jgi:hypothetical protein
MEGKALYTPTPEEERQHQQRENLLTAIGILTSLGKTFERPEYWNESHQQRAAAETSTESRYYTFAELVEVRAAGEQPGTFAAREVKEIESTLQEVRELASRGYYEGHPVYSYAKKYIVYLEGLEVEAETQAASNQHQQHGNRPKAETEVQLKDILEIEEKDYNAFASLFCGNHRKGVFKTVEPFIFYLEEENLYKEGISIATKHAAFKNTFGCSEAYSNFTKALRQYKDPKQNEGCKQLAKKIKEKLGKV